MVGDERVEEAVLADSELSQSEQRLVHAAGVGVLADLRSGDPALDDLSQAPKWSPERVLRAEILLELLTGRRVSTDGQCRGVRVAGARIVGPLNLEAAEVNVPLLLWDCFIDEPINLMDARTQAVRLPGCHIPGIVADQMVSRGNVSLGRSIIKGEVGLLGAHVGGQLDLNGARLSNPGGYALNADNVTVDQTMSCQDGFTAEGEVRLLGGRIGGQLVLNGARLSNPSGSALTADGLTVAQDMACDEGFAAQGQVRILGSHIGGQLRFNGARLSNPDGYALAAEQVTVDEGMNCEGGFTAKGEVALIGASIGGQLLFDGAHLSNPNGSGLSAHALTVGQSMHCRAGFTVDGEVHLDGAHISGQLLFDGAHLSCVNGPALAAGGIVVDLGISFQAGFTADGEVYLSGARIGGQLVFDGARLSNPSGSALAADSLVVNKGMFCANGFVTKGEVLLSDAHIGGQLLFDGAHLSHSGGFALSAQMLTVEGAMLCRQGFVAEGGILLTGANIREVEFQECKLINPDDYALAARALKVDGNLSFGEGFTADGGVRLVGARVGGRFDFSGAILVCKSHGGIDLEGLQADTLVMPHRRPAGVFSLINAKVRNFRDRKTGWPTEIKLRGFIYDNLESDITKVRERLKWLERDQSGYMPGPFDQLAAAYRRAGHVEDARRIGLAKQRRRRHELNSISKLWNWLLYMTVGYGYRTWLALLWLIGLSVAGSVAFAAYHPHDLIPSGSAVPEFQPVAYALDVLLPVVDLGQQKAWVAQGAALVWTWVLITAGWILATAVVAGLTNALKRD